MYENISWWRGSHVINLAVILNFEFHSIHQSIDSKYGNYYGVYYVTTLSAHCYVSLTEF